MKKLVFIVIAILLSITTIFAQNRSATLKQTTLNATGETFKDVFFDASDTINESETYYVEFTCKKNYPQEIDVYLAGSAVTGSGDVDITVYGKKFSGSTYTSIGTSTWNSTLALDEVITVSTPQKYRFFKVEFVADATEKQVLVTDIRFKTWIVSGVLAGTSVDLSGTLTVAGETTLNDHLNMGAGDDILGSTTSDINFGSGNFTVAGATGNTATAGDLAVDGTANLDNTDIDGTFTMDGTAFDVNSTSTVNIDNTNTTNGIDIGTSTSAVPIDIGHATSEVTIGDNLTVSGDADVVGAFTAGSIASDAAITAVSGIDIGTSQAIVGTTAMTVGAGSQTIAISSSDWAIDATGAATGMGAITSDGAVTGTSFIAPLYDVTGAAAITFGSPDVTSFTFSGISEDLVLTPSADLWTLSTSTGATAIAIGGLNLTGVGTIGSGKVSSTGGVDLGTSQALTGTTALTIGAGTETVAVNSSDWDIDATGAMTGIGAITSDGLITAGGGVALPTASTHIWAAGGSVVSVTAGADVACSDGDRYWTEIMIPYNVTITGASYLVGSVGGTDSVVMQLFNSAGVEVATSKTTGANHGAIVGTTAEFQNCDFTSPYAAVAGVYYVGVQFNGTTAKFRAYTIPNSKFVAATAGGTWDTKADITPGTTFTADKGPIILTY